MTITIVIPALNEAEGLDHLYERILAASSDWAEDFEIVIVDDGSSDGTMEWCRKIGQSDPRLKAIRFTRNFGHQAAVTAGLRYASGEAVVTSWIPGLSTVDSWRLSRRSAASWSTIRNRSCPS